MAKITLDTPVLLQPGVYYVAKRYHRNRHREKSQWKITVHLEVTSFYRSYCSDWHDNVIAWGLNMPANAPAILGLSVERLPVLVAKFRNSGPYWSGYPVDYQKTPEDRPSPAVLRAWWQAGIIQKHEISRVRSGRPCSLSD